MDDWQSALGMSAAEVAMLTMAAEAWETTPELFARQFLWETMLAFLPPARRERAPRLPPGFPRSPATPAE